MGDGDRVDVGDQLPLTECPDGAGTRGLRALLKGDGEGARRADDAIWFSTRPVPQAHCSEPRG